MSRDKDYWKTKEYLQNCKDRLEEIEHVVERFYWYSSGEGLHEFKKNIQSDADFVYYVHRCHSMYLRWWGSGTECPYCDEECWGWNGVDKRCENDNSKNFYWEHEDEGFSAWVENYSINDDHYLGHGTTW